MSSAEVPRFCVVLRKAFAAGYYAMSSPGFEPRATIALEGAQIGAMAGEAAINAVLRQPGSRRSRTPTSATRSSPSGSPSTNPSSTRSGWPSELLIDAVIDRAAAARASCERRLADAEGWQRRPPGRHHGAFPV